MFKNYFQTTWRILMYNKGLSLIKIIGLSVGLTVCMVIFLYTKDEFSFDRFHEHQAQLYRIVQKFRFDNQPDQIVGITNGIVGETFAKEIPEVQQVVRVTGAPVTIKTNKEVFTENPLFVDRNYFSVFSFPLVEGNQSTALNDAHAVVISTDMAIKYFGTIQVVGRTMQIKLADDFENFIVSAVAKPAPQNSTLRTDILLPYSYYDKFNSNQGWFGGSVNTFLLLAPRSNIREVERKMQVIFDVNTRDFLAQRAIESGTKTQIQLALQLLTDIHLGKPAGPDHGLVDGSSPQNSYILSYIAIFILVIACINFINLSTAQSLKRRKEIGIKKVVGATRKQLFIQFLAESFLVSLIAFVIAIGIAVLILPYFNELADKKLSFAYLSDGYVYAGYFSLLLITSFLAGFYPSLVLSSFQPVKDLSGSQRLSGKKYLTKGLIVLQFSLSILLIIGTIVINSQLTFLTHKDLGYDNTNLVRVEIPMSHASNTLPALFRNELRTQSGIIAVAAKNGGRSLSGARANNRNISIENSRIDENFLTAFHIPIIAGRNFSADYPSDSGHAVIVNESFAKAAGWQPMEAIGKTIAYGQDNRAVTIVGIVKDYHYTSLKEPIQPELLSMNPNFNYGELWVKIKPDNIPQTLGILQKTYRKIVPYFPYSFQFMNYITAKNYENEKRWQQIITIASGLFIFISCIGLLGLVMFSVQQRTKEIGIRKVLGAAVSNIVLLVSKEFLALILIAYVIAVPAGFYFINEWLQDFAYRISMAWWMFALAGVCMVGMAMITISFHAVKAAFTNPVKSLKTE